MKTKAAICSALAGLAILAAGCGDDSASATPPTAAEIKRCILDGGGRVWGQIPTKPPGFPKPDETVKTIGPELGHITVYLSRRPVFTEQIAKGFRPIGEYVATVARDGQALILLDDKTSKTDSDLAFDCLEG